VAIEPSQQGCCIEKQKSMACFSIVSKVADKITRMFLCPHQKSMVVRAIFCIALAEALLK